MRTVLNERQIREIKNKVRWRGKVSLYQLKEDDDAFLAEHISDGTPRYACVVTGLMFCKDTGKCLSSTNIELRLETLVPESSKRLDSWLRERKMADYGYNVKFDHMKDDGEED